MTGMNDDDLHSYLYVSENYGANWKSIAKGLPDEPFNVIREDPTNENILYAGGFRGVFISVNRGNDWSLLGGNLPQAAIADLKFNEPTMDLIAATYGRGIFKINLKPIHKVINLLTPNYKNRFFGIDTLRRPWFNSNGGEPLYQTLEKTSFTFWLNQAQPITLSLHDKSNKEIWKVTFNGLSGFNDYRWNLVIRKRESDEPYFINYEEFIKSGKYTLVASTETGNFEQSIIVADEKPPHLN